MNNDEWLEELEKYREITGAKSDADLARKLGRSKSCVQNYVKKKNKIGYLTKLNILAITRPNIKIREIIRLIK